jgi:hypothetical protein
MKMMRNRKRRRIRTSMSVRLFVEHEHGVFDLDVINVPT